MYFAEVLLLYHNVSHRLNSLKPSHYESQCWIRTLGTNFSELLSIIHTSSFKKMHLKYRLPKWRPSCLGLNVLKQKRITELLIIKLDIPKVVSPAVLVIQSRQTFIKQKPVRLENTVWRKWSRRGGKNRNIMLLIFFLVIAWVKLLT